MNTAQLLNDLHVGLKNRAYIRNLNVIAQTRNVLKARLVISTDLFVQVYRNDQFDTTNLILLHNNQRVYARDQLGGNWHRHQPDTPRTHDTSSEGRRSVTLAEFLDEVEALLLRLDLL